MTTRELYRSGIQYAYDDQSFETTNSGSGWAFTDDFVGAGHTAGIPAAGSPAAGYPWVKKIVGAAPPTVALINNASGGQIQCALAANSEAEEASLYWNDSLSLDTSKNGMIEWRTQLAVAPSAAGVQAFVGVGSAWVGGPQNLARYFGFLWTANNSLLIVSKDGAGDTYSFAAAQIGGAAITTDTNFHYYRISWENQADLAFFVDGNRVNTVGSVIWNPGASNAIFQPWHTVYKPSGTGVATINLDKLDAFNTR